MNEQEQRQIYRRWRHAESTRAEKEAERSLALLLRALPTFQPQAGFASRVIDALGPLPIRHSPRIGPLPSLWLRATVCAALIIVGLGLPLAGQGLWWLGRWIGLADLTSALAQGFLSFLQSIDVLMAIFAFLEDIREALLTVIAAPPVVASLLAMGLVSLLAYRCLGFLFTTSRSRSYA
jgi:hypothetical protein